MVCHELRTPLASIRGYLEDLLEGETDPSRVRRCLQTLQRETLRLARMLDGVTELSLLDTSVMPPAAATCNVAERVEAAVAVLAPLAARRGVRLHVCGAVQASRVRAEPDACMHVLLNLIDNAVTHGNQNGNVRIAHATADAFVEIAVDDDGPGFCAEPKRGHGLGLRISHAIARRSNGEIRFERSPLGGVRALFRLPAEDEAEKRSAS